MRPPRVKRSRIPPIRGEKGRGILKKRGGYPVKDAASHERFRLPAKPENCKDLVKIPFLGRKYPFLRRSRLYGNTDTRS